VDAGPKWRLKEVAVRHGGRIPPQRAEVGGEDTRVIGSLFATFAQPSSARTAESSSASQRTAAVSPWAVIVDAGETERIQSIDRPPVLDQPTARANANEVARLRRALHFQPPRRPNPLRNSEQITLGLSNNGQARALYHGFSIRQGGSAEYAKRWNSGPDRATLSDFGT
jgi:hypothetical protein